MAFIALIALLNGLLGLIGSWFDIKLSLDLIFGYLLSPFAILIGVSPGEAVQARSFIGQKLAINEFVAYANLGPHMAEFSDKTNLILTFAICGFANFSSIAIQLGVTGTLAPTRRKQIAQLGIKAVIAGTLANFLNASCRYDVPINLYRVFSFYKRRLFHAIQASFVHLLINLCQI